MTFDDVIRHFKSQGNVARALHLSQPSIHSWREKGVPHLRQLQLEALTRGKLKAAPEAKVPPPKPERPSDATATGPGALD